MPNSAELWAATQQEMGGSEKFLMGSSLIQGAKDEATALVKNKDLTVAQAIASLSPAIVAAGVAVGHMIAHGQVDAASLSTHRLNRTRRDFKRGK